MKKVDFVVGVAPDSLLRGQGQMAQGTPHDPDIDWMASGADQPHQAHTTTCQHHIDIFFEIFVRKKIDFVVFVAPDSLPRGQHEVSRHTSCRPPVPHKLPGLTSQQQAVPKCHKHKNIFFFEFFVALNPRL